MIFMWLIDIILNFFWVVDIKKLNFLDKYDIDNFSYKTFYISKKNWGKRRIDTPNEELLKVQRDILRTFEKNILLPKYITAFRKHFSIRTNAKHHINKKIIVNIDLKDFFQSVTEEKLKKMFINLKFNPKKIDKLIKIITYNWSLPQWAPSSWFFANLAFAGIDKIIIKILQKYDKNVSYTRYADDITFSSDNVKIVNAIRIIENILKQYGYKINKDKICIYRKNKRQLVTWLVVNEKVSYPKDKYFLLKAMVYNFIKNWEWDFFKIKGHLSFLYSVDKIKYKKLKKYYGKRFWENSSYKKLFKIKNLLF